MLRLCSASAASLAEGDMFEEVEVAGKGRGLRASREVRRGDIVLTERPIIVWDTSKHYTVNLAQSILHHSDPGIALAVMPGQTGNLGFSGLSRQETAAVLALHDDRKDFHAYHLLTLSEKEIALHCELIGADCRKEEYLMAAKKEIFDKVLDDTTRKILRIICCNSVSLECKYEKKNLNTSGLFLLHSRINHSCCPNLAWSWVREDPTKRVSRLRALRKIKKGEEMTVAYKTVRGTKAERARMLQQYFPVCLCSLCCGPEEEVKKNDKVRLQIQQLDTELDWLDQQAVLGRQTGERLLQLANLKLKLMKSIKTEMIKDIPGQMVECCLVAGHLPGYVTPDRERKLCEMARAAQAICSSQGDYFLHRLTSDPRWKTLPYK